MNPIELAMRRRNVTAFMDADPIDIQLVREVKTRIAGGWTLSTLPPLPPQRIRLVPSKRRYADVHVNTEAGPIDLWPYQLLGDHDMDIQEGDTFTVGAMHFQVRSLEYDNEERVVAACAYFGAEDNA